MVGAFTIVYTYISLLRNIGNSYDVACTKDMARLGIRSINYLLQ